MEPVSEYLILEDQSHKVLTHEEGHFFDVKSIDIAPGKLTKTISALANADGGELYVGIDEVRDTGSKQWRGFPNQESANGHLQIFESLFPLGQDFHYSFLKSVSKPGLVLKIEILKNRSIVLATDGVAYLRRGAQNLPVTTDEAKARLKSNKGITSFETELVNAPVDIITNSTKIIGFMLQVVPSAEPEDWLRKQLLIRDDKPAVAGTVLFSEEPQAVLPKRCGIKIYRYKTNSERGSRDTLAGDPLTIEGCIYDQVAEAVLKTTEIIEGVKVMGKQGFESIKYPTEALHEIITNAVLHRDYSLTDDIHVRVFDNRVEIESPGTLPAHITVDNILDERFSRNATIVRLINKFPNPPNKDVGEGLNTAFEAMTNLKLKTPLIQQRENSVLVILRHEPLASPEQIIMDYLENEPSVNNSKARELCHVGSENVMKRVFKKMMANQLIEQIPETRSRATAYRKSKKTTE